MHPCHGFVLFPALPNARRQLGVLALHARQRPFLGTQEAGIRDHLSV
jgi:hypothetical protein